MFFHALKIFQLNAHYRKSANFRIPNPTPGSLGSKHFNNHAFR